MFKKITQFISKYRKYFFVFLMICFGFPVATITAETDFRTGFDNIKSGTRSFVYYIEIDTATGLPKADHQFGLLPEALEVIWAPDNNDEAQYNCENNFSFYSQKENKTSLKFKFKADSIALENFIMRQSQGKEFMILFSGGEDPKLVEITVGETTVTRKAEKMYLAGRVMFPHKYEWASGKRSPEITIPLAKPIVPITLPCAVDTSINPILPTNIVAQWGLDEATFKTKTFAITPDVLLYDYQLCAKSA